MHYQSLTYKALCCLILNILFFPGAVHADEPAFRFPVYKITADQVVLDSLDRDPISDDYYPATFTYNDITIPCRIRYRGATSRKYPKKSWKIKFEDNNNIFRAEELNLNAEYNDKTFLRNYLSNSLFTFVGIPAPSCSYINLFVNDVHYGLYLRIEQIDEHFLSRHDKKEGALYKALSHAASMAPLIHDNNYRTVWNPKDNADPHFTDIKALFNKIYYWNREDFERSISGEVDVDTVLLYYAVLFSIASNDNYCKNHYLYANPDTDLFEIIPWDNDATFGYSWRGLYIEVWESFIYGTYLDNQHLFRRLMQNVEWNARFWEHVRYVVSPGFTHLDSVIDGVYDDLRHDIMLDPQKPASKEEFDPALEQLRHFMASRSETLLSAGGFGTPQLYEYRCSNPFPDAAHPSVTFTVRSTEPQKIDCLYITDLDFTIPADVFTTSKIALYDDGLHGDMKAGDLIYGNTITLDHGFRGLVPYAFATSTLMYPENGFSYINRTRTHSLVLNAVNDSQEYIEHISIGKLHSSAGNRFVKILNSSARKIDMSYCYLQCGDYYNRTIFPENTVIAPHDRIIVATDIASASLLFDGTVILGNECNIFGTGEYVKLLGPDYSVIDEKHCLSFDMLMTETHNIVINEINYNSSPDFDTDDWVELHNTEEVPVDLSGWVLKDSDDSHAFVFPLDTVIGAHGYLVLVRDADAFASFFPDVHNFLGNFDFGFRGDGENIRLYSSRAGLIDSLSYNDREPWPEDPDGNGSTLALVNPCLDNSVPGNWRASGGHGTPGTANDVHSERVPDSLSAGQNYPNPFNGSTSIPFSLNVSKKVRVDIFNVLGQHVATVLDKRMNSGSHTVVFHAHNLPAGLYIYRVKTNTTEKCGKLTIVK